MKASKKKKVKTEEERLLRWEWCSFKRGCQRQFSGDFLDFARYTAFENWRQRLKEREEAIS